MLVFMVKQHTPYRTRIVVVNNSDRAIVVAANADAVFDPAGKVLAHSRATIVKDTYVRDNGEVRFYDASSKRLLERRRLGQDYMNAHFRPEQLTLEFPLGSAWKERRK